MSALDAYLAWRVERKHGVTVKKGAYRGLDPESALFLTEDGGAYALTKRMLPSGVWSYSCNTLGAYISRLHANAGIEGGSAQSALFASVFNVINLFKMPAFRVGYSFFWSKH